MLKNRTTAVIIEESAEELLKLTSLLKRFPEILIVGEAISGIKGLSLIFNYAPQLVFLNIDLPDMCGFEISRQLHKKNYYPEMIFVARDDQLAFDSLKFKPLDFFLKPVEKKEVTDMLARYKLNEKKNAITRKLNSYAKFFKIEAKRIFTLNNGIVVLYLDEIVICRASRSKTILTLTCGHEVELPGSVKETIETINDDKFLKTSRSFWINRNYLRKIDKRRRRCLLFFEGNSWEVPVTKSSMKMLEALITYPVY